MTDHWTAPSYKFATTVDLMAVVERGREVLSEIDAMMLERRLEDEDPVIDRTKAIVLARELRFLSERFLHLIDALGMQAP